MSAKVSSFEKVRLGDYQYLFFLVAWSDYETSLKAELQLHLEKFGENIGEQGLLVQAYDKDKWETGEQILSKDWGDLNERLEQEQEPFLLIMDTDFAQFEPARDRWVIIWISDYFEDRQAIPSLLFSIQKKVKKGEDLFSRLEGMQAQSGSWALVKNGMLSQTAQHFQIGNKAWEDGSLEVYGQRVRQAVSEGNLRQGIAYLRELDLPFQKEVLLLSNRLESLRLDQIRGTLREEEERVERNKIALALLELVG